MSLLFLSLQLHPGRRKPKTKEKVKANHLSELQYERRISSIVRWRDNSMQTFLFGNGIRHVTVSPMSPPSPISPGGPDSLLWNIRKAFLFAFSDYSDENRQEKYQTKLVIAFTQELRDLSPIVISLLWCGLCLLAQLVFIFISNTYMHTCTVDLGYWP